MMLASESHRNILHMYILKSRGTKIDPWGIPSNKSR